MPLCSPSTLLEKLNMPGKAMRTFWEGTVSVAFVPLLPSVSAGFEMSFSHACYFKMHLKIILPSSRKV